MLVALSAAVGVLILRFLGAQRRESELRQEVAKKTADLQSANEKLSVLSSTDPLTGLANKRVFDQALGWECARVQRMNSVTSLLSIDVDHFKALNDTQGHLRGDECLVALSAELTRLCRRKLGLGRALRRRGVRDDSSFNEVRRCGAHSRSLYGRQSPVSRSRIPHRRSPRSLR